VDTFHETGKLKLINEKLIKPLKIDEKIKNLDVILTGTTHPQSLHAFLNDNMGEYIEIIDK
jgi:hypothetical protein